MGLPVPVSEEAAQGLKFLGKYAKKTMPKAKAKGLFARGLKDIPKRIRRKVTKLTTRQAAKTGVVLTNNKYTNFGADITDSIGSETRANYHVRGIRPGEKAYKRARRKVRQQIIDIGRKTNKFLAGAGAFVGGTTAGVTAIRQNEKDREYVRGDKKNKKEKPFIRTPSEEAALGAAGAAGYSAFDAGLRTAIMSAATGQTNKQILKTASITALASALFAAPFGMGMGYGIAKANRALAKDEKFRTPPKKKKKK